MALDAALTYSSSACANTGLGYHPTIAQNCNFCPAVLRLSRSITAGQQDQHGVALPFALHGPSRFAEVFLQAN